ncbi:MAG: DUF2029 domain-containing protein [Ekhidna sp.]|nr:DUF2029 domain-containing protein [Ekhidna sp.]
MIGTKQDKAGHYTFLIVFILGILSLGSWVERHQTTLILMAYCSTFVSYVFLVLKPLDLKQLVTLGFIARLVLFISMPVLSDDVYRFIWDGTLLKNGIHPFEALPGTYLDQNIDELSQELFNKLNSPNYFTIYPPINQFIFWISVIVCQENWLVAAGIIRIFLFAADFGSFIFLKKLCHHYGKSEAMAYWFWLNPMIILEFTGNLHFEGVVIFFVLAGMFYYEKNKNLFASLGFGLAIGTKLLPLIYLPFLFLKGIKAKQWSVSILAGAIATLTLLPLLNASFISAMRESLDLYFRSFEFNASIYFIAREIGFWMYGYNNIAKIGPLLSILSFLTIIAISIAGVVKKWPIPKALLFILTSYLLFATTVHPWYVLPLVAFGLLSGYWYPLVWSFFIFFTYAGYSQEGFELPMYIIVIEYVFTGLVLILELRKKK